MLLKMYVLVVWRLLGYGEASEALMCCALFTGSREVQKSHNTTQLPGAET